MLILQFSSILHDDRPTDYVSACSFVDAVTPILEMVHVSSVVDSTHRQCSSSVRSENKALRDYQTENKEGVASKTNSTDIIFMVPKVGLEE